jgi:hypothetical protein
MATSRANRLAKACGALYLYIILAGSFAELAVRGRLIHPQDAAATARDLLAHEALFRTAATGEFLHLTADVGVAVGLYLLFEGTHRPLALLAGAMRLACDLILAVAGMTQFAALRLLHGATVLPSLTQAQREELALFALRLHGDGYAISLLFFAFACLALGRLLDLSGAYARILGPLLTLAGGCYLATSLLHFLNPAFAHRLVPLLLPIPFVAELSLAVTLLVKGAGRLESGRA